MLTVLALATLLSGQAAPAPAQAPALPTTGGVAPAPDCGGLAAQVAEGKPIQCVTAPLERIGDLARAYAGEAQRHGWTPVRADNNVVWLQKPETAGICQRMTLVVFWDWIQHPEPVVGLPGYLGSIVETGQTCETAPPASPVTPNGQ